MASMQGLVFRKCGEKLKTAEHNPIFGNKTAGRGSTKQGSGRLISVLPCTFDIAGRKYAANSGNPEHTAFLRKETAGRRVGTTWHGRPKPILPHTFGFDASYSIWRARTL